MSIRGTPARQKQRSKWKRKVTVIRSLDGLSHKAAIAEAMESRTEIAQLANELHAAKEKNLVAAKLLAEELIAIRLDTGEYVTKERLAEVQGESDIYQQCFESHAEKISALEIEARLPIPMRITCPDCGTLHIDEGAKSHHTHSCQSCGLTWRPAVHATVGVRFLPGFKGPIGDETVSAADVAGGGGTWISESAKSYRWTASKITGPCDDSAIGISADKVK